MINVVLDGDESVLEWEYFVTREHKDGFASLWSKRLGDIQRNYGDEESGRMINEEGIEELKKLKSVLLQEMQ
jgi:hypothetical protein